MSVRALTVPLTLHVEVTADDIEEGVDACDACPIALAITRILHERDPADQDLRGWTDGFFAAVVDAFDHELLAGRLPEDAREFVQRHDSLDSVSPFAFTLTLAPHLEPRS